ncbi:hypothetical protein JTE90_000516 [Oedothorax gibbosus]|uniref:Uncharacterized protein n=1 Tax=Oedothorax gibbosus TaxID=931172 RepID=A0AAV6VXI6_9ARAC|nr:hypothetical protein JTE90_000516 [Oedothorax gibbosus]
MRITQLFTSTVLDPVDSYLLIRLSDLPPGDGEEQSNRVSILLFFEIGDYTRTVPTQLASLVCLLNSPIRAVP